MTAASGVKSQNCVQPMRELWHVLVMLVDLHVEWTAGQPSSYHSQVAYIQRRAEGVYVVTR